MADLREPAQLDGQAVALALLRHLEQVNSVHWRRRKSTVLVASAIAALPTMPETERMRFLAVISDRLVSDVIGLCLDNDDYEMRMRFNDSKRCAREAGRRDREFQKFIASVQGDSTSATT